MAVTFIGVRHHSPACARLVRRTIETLRPAYVLVEGPADVNDRLDELLLGHQLPIAIFSHYRDDERAHLSWAPFCAYSPEWVALTVGRAHGAKLRFIDLPAWHPALAGRRNRYADAEQRYADAADRLCRAFAVDNVDALWDRLVEVEPDDGLEERLATYFDLVRGETETGEDDTAREAYMAAWVRAAAADAGDRPVVVVTGGFHRPALRRLVAEPGSVVPEITNVRAVPVEVTSGLHRPAPRTGTEEPAGPLEVTDRSQAPGASPVADAGDGPVEVGGGLHPGGDGPEAARADVGADPAGAAARLPRSAASPLVAASSGWPEIPRPAAGAVGGSYLVPYSFRRLDAFSGYQSGMPSPEYYQRLWEQGADAAADGLVEAVATRLRGRGVAVSTADLIAARTLSAGLARLRGHPHPARTDILDGLVSALVSDDLDQPLPWTRRGALEPGAHPVVAEMVAALSGDRTGRLHPDTPAPPLVHDVDAELARLGLDRTGTVELDLSDAGDLVRARALHRLRVLRVPGYRRVSGPVSGADPVLDERWELTDDEERTAALIEAGAYGGTLRDAATAVLAEGVAAAGTKPDGLAAVLFDAALCGVTDLSEQITELIAANIAGARELGPLGDALATVLALWRHDRVLGTAGSPMYAAVIDGAVTRVLWLAEGVHGGPAPADPARLRAVTATRDALLHAHEVLSTGREAALDVMARIGADREAPPDLRGAAFGFGWSLGASADPVRALRGAAGADTLGDWLAGLFALARDEVLADGGSAGGGVLAVLDDLVTTMPDFLAGLPALRQAFAYFPPRERELIARRLLERRRLTGSARALLRTTADPLLIAEARALEERTSRLLAGEGLLP
ncbi:DUF5682 family protein [Actinoallomurus iriomotensis]|uniref:Uncharacterized protein n=1 Tax=Actinoallomurus iriomotensis TaxID=478107 RepID=A0A9W6RJZ1_9ACTN|nr:DUF5682 family protein [Actinoallomurus iriomotensis]GLY77516.1 hypothetical protein Airi01_057830 [Actinoallomurus iriomotensis]